jgi:hypothetical protein
LCGGFGGPSGAFSSFRLNEFIPLMAMKITNAVTIQVGQLFEILENSKREKGILEARLFPNSLILHTYVFVLA